MRRSGMNEIKVLQYRLLVFGLGAILLGGFVVYYAMREDGLAVAGISLGLIYVSLRAGHSARELAKVKDKMEQEGEQGNES